MSKTLVMKFGGTSVGSVAALINVTQIIRDAKRDWDRVVVVTSAMSGVTNLLLDSAASASRGTIVSLSEAESTLRQKHFSAADALIKDETLREETKVQINALIFSLVNLCKAIAVLGEASPRAMDAVASLGERMSVRLLAAVVIDAGIKAKAIESSEFVVTNIHFLNAHPDFKVTTEKTRGILNPLMNEGILPITTGFIGATPEGVITTLGRGGSDYSAAIIASVLPADDVWIWTDVDGVMTTDPRIVKEAKTLSEISYGEIAELAYYGAKVLHPKTIRPVVEAGIGLRICNTFNPSHPGTRLKANGHAAGSHGKANKGEQIIKAVTAIRSQRLVTIEGRGMLGVPGVAGHIFSAVATTGVSVPLIIESTSEQAICFPATKDLVPAVLDTLHTHLKQDFQRGDSDRVIDSDEVDIITVFCPGLRVTPGVAGQIFGILGEAAIKVLGISFGASDVSINLIVAAQDTQDAVLIQGPQLGFTIHF